MNNIIKYFISKNEISLINQLKKKSKRYKYGLFIVEGVKSINELIQSNVRIHSLYMTKYFFKKKRLFILKKLHYI